MNMKYKIGYLCYSLSSGLMAVMGLRYIFASQIMPYHLVALDTTWQELPSVYRLLFLNFMRSVGIGFISSAMAAVILILIPYRNNESWARWSIFAIHIMLYVSLLIIVMWVRIHTPALPPVGPFILGILLSLSGLLLSGGIRSARRQP